MKTEIKQLKTKEQFLEKMYDSFGSDDLFEGVEFGQYEGEDFLIVESWEALTRIGAVLNGYEGNLDIAVVWGIENLNKEMNKAITELDNAKQENPDKPWIAQRYEKRLKQLINLSDYHQWLESNEIESIDFNDIGIETGFSDEYSKCCGNCNGCQNIVRTSPDSYFWTPPLYIDGEGFTCDDCAQDHSEYVLEEYKNKTKSIPSQFNTDELGLVKVNDESYQQGMHEGMDDSPEPILKHLNNADIDVWFLVHPSQFYYEFDVYVRTEDKDRATEILAATDTYQGFSTAGNLQKALQEATEQMAQLPSDQGIKYAKVNIDGTAETRVVSNEEFIKGIKD